MTIQDLKEAKVISKFLANIEIKETGCWEWQGSKDKKGYGNFYDGQTIRAYKYSYQLFNGIVPDGLEIDHLCRNHPCVNPEHLEAVTHQENMLRSPLLNNANNHCPHGHEYTPENTTYTAGGFRLCRICNREACAKYYETHKATMLAKQREYKHRIRHG